MTKTITIPQAIVGRITALYITDDPKVLREIYEGNRVCVGTLLTWLQGPGEPLDLYHLIAELTPQERPAQ